MTKVEVDDKLVYGIHIYFPETAGLDVTHTVDWALRKHLGVVQKQKKVRVDLVGEQKVKP
jgi:hypothetical protein